MFRLLLLPVALLLPTAAQADPLLDVAATAIHYAKWAFVLVGALLLFRAVANSTSGKPISKSLLLAILMTAIPSVILSITDTIGINTIVTGGNDVGGRPIVEYMAAQAGLLDAALLANWGVFGVIAMAVVFGSCAVVAMKAFREGEDRFKAELLAYGVPALFILAFNPWWQTSSTNNPKALPGSQQVGSSADHLKLPGAMPSSSTVLPFVASRTKQLISLQGATAKTPFMLSTINAAMDEFIGGMVSLFSAKGFSQYGMAGVEGMMSNIGASLPSWISPDLQNRLMGFMDTCVYQQIARSINKTSVANGWATDPKGMAEKFDPFSMVSLRWYNHQKGMQLCAKMIVGGYSLGGQQYPVGLGDEIMADYALSDPRIRHDFPQMKTVKDAETNLSKIKSMYSDWQGLIASIFRNSIEKKYEAQAAAEAANTLSTGMIGSMLKGVERDVFQAVSTAKQAGATAQVDLEMPIWMGLVQNIWLALFPVVFVMALLPGMAKTLGFYFLTLLWSKSYVVAWALISNFDHWQSAALSYMGSGVRAADKLAIIHAIQLFQMVSPVVMTIVFFGPKIGAMAISKVGGA